VTDEAPPLPPPAPPDDVDAAPPTPLVPAPPPAAHPGEVANEMIASATSGILFVMSYS
jgi:hypothetical protein